MFDPSDYTTKSMIQKDIEAMQRRISTLEATNITSLMQSRKAKNVDALENRISELVRDNESLKSQCNSALYKEKLITRNRDHFQEELEKFKLAHAENRREIEKRGNAINHLNSDNDHLREVNLALKAEIDALKMRPYQPKTSGYARVTEGVINNHADAIHELQAKLIKMEKNQERLQKYVHEKAAALHSLGERHKEFSEVTARTMRRTHDEHQVLTARLESESRKVAKILENSDKKIDMAIDSAKRAEYEVKQMKHFGAH